jgi:hypothetical protein
MLEEPETLSKVPEIKVIFITPLRCYFPFPLGWYLNRGCKTTADKTTSTLV